MKRYLVLFLCSSLNAATVVPYSVSPGGTYSTLASAIEAANDAGDLVALDTAVDIVISGNWVSADTTAVSVDGFTSTDSDNNITIRTTGEARHEGKWDASKYRLSSSAIALTLNEYCTIDGLQIECSASSGAIRGVNINITGIYVIADSVLVKGNLTGTAAGYGFRVSSSLASTLSVRNSVAYNWINGSTASGGFTSSSSSTVITLNCTAYNCYRGFYQAAGALVSTNCINQLAGIDGFAGPITGLNNCSDIASDAPGTSPVTGTVLFADAANGDFHLSASDTVAKDQGADLSGDFTTDIDGQTRTGTWDIGADEYIVTGGGETSNLVQPFGIKSWRW
jgi:hypothetical protein